MQVGTNTGFQSVRDQFAEVLEELRAEGGSDGGNTELTVNLIVGDRTTEQLHYMIEDGIRTGRFTSER